MTLHPPTPGQGPPGDRVQCSVQYIWFHTPPLPNPFSHLCPQHHPKLSRRQLEGESSPRPKGGSVCPAVETTLEACPHTRI